MTVRFSRTFETIDPLNYTYEPRVAKCLHNSAPKTLCLFFVAVAFVLDFSVGSVLAQPASLKSLPEHFDNENVSYVHGTIDVVISTREGFVLATDSRLTTNEEGAHRDDGRKLFAFGQRGAAVIAGVIGSQIGVAGFDLRDSIESALTLAGKLPDAQLASAQSITRSFEFGFSGVAGLLRKGTVPPANRVAQIIAVSFDPGGAPEWVKETVSLAATEYNGKPFLKAGEPVKEIKQLRQPLGFDCEAIGYPLTVELLLKADRPISEEFASGGLARYYDLKAKGKLDELSLEEAIELARTLVEATIKLAPSTAGVGGPIDTATLTPKGLTWVKRKKLYAPSTPMYIARLFGAYLANGRQPLDGLECLKCTFNNMELVFSGTAQPKLIEPEFQGSCKLRILPEARVHMAEAVARLEQMTRNSCVLTDEGKNAIGTPTPKT